MTEAAREETPIVDAVVRRVYNDLFDDDDTRQMLKALIPVARALELDLTALRQTVAEMEVRHAAVMLHAQTHAEEYNALRQSLAEQERIAGEAERDAKRMLAALEKIAQPVYVNMGPLYADPHNVKTICDGMNERIKIAADALAALSEREDAKP